MHDNTTIRLGLRVRLHAAQQYRYVQNNIYIKNFLSRLSATESEAEISRVILEFGPPGRGRLRSCLSQAFSTALSRVKLPGLGRDFSLARARRGAKNAESGGAELSDGRRLVPQNCSD